MRHDSALKIAEALVEYFRPVCIRIEIAGSIKRWKPEVKDIEIIAVPDLTPLRLQKLEFGKPIPRIYKTHLDQLLGNMELENPGRVSLAKNGERYKKIILKDSDIVLDLFLVLPPAQWGVQSVIRTGPAEFSHWMVTRKSRGGALPDGYIVEDGVVGKRVKNAKNEDSREGEIEMPEEIDFLSFCGLPWIEPKDRVARWNK